MEGVENLSTSELKEYLIDLKEGIYVFKDLKETPERILDIMSSIKNVESELELRRVEEVAVIPVIEPPKPLLSEKLPPKQKVILSSGSLSEKKAVSRLSKRKPFSKTSDSQKFKTLANNVKFLLRNYSNASKKEVLKAKYKKEVTDAVNLCIEFINKRAEKEWVEILLNHKTYSSCYKKKRFGFNLEKVLKDFDLL